jgi:acyl-CoA reductase-like NAD-dependent aldehyde dehydrogenase
MLKPLISAISAGCPCICKLSEVSVQTSLVLKKIIEEFTDPSGQYVRCVFGGVAHATALLNLTTKLGVVFYTVRSPLHRSVASLGATAHCTTLLPSAGATRTNHVLFGAHRAIRWSARSSTRSARRALLRASSR